MFSRPDYVPALYRRSKVDWERRGSSLESSDLMASRSASIAAVEGTSADFAIQHSVYTECDTSLSVPSFHHPRCRYALPFSLMIRRPCFWRIFSLRELEGRAGVSTTHHPLTDITVPPRAEAQCVCEVADRVWHAQWHVITLQFA